jgi:light-regulated signal transduction histidine kinase (bacteriophytochrome)
LNEDLKQFAFAAGHDLQEPLRMIRCYSELLLRSCGDQAGTNAELFTRYIRQGTGRMQELLTDLLSYMHLTQSDTEEDAEADLQGALNIALENLDAALRESGTTVECEPLPVVRGTETQFVQVFQNLIANAIKYRGADPPHIRVCAEEKTDAWRIFIRDNGIGIAPEYHDQIFGVFKRLHGKEIPGTGIGLSICKRIVERLGGRIWVESEGGAGSTFLMDLPR